MAETSKVFVAFDNILAMSRSFYTMLHVCVWHLRLYECATFCLSCIFLSSSLPNVLVAVSKGTWPVKLCTNRILQFLTGGCQLSQVDRYNVAVVLCSSSDFL